MLKPKFGFILKKCQSVEKVYLNVVFTAVIKNKQKNKTKRRPLPAFPDTDHVAIVQTEVDNKNTFQFQSADLERVKSS